MQGTSKKGFVQIASIILMILQLTCAQLFEEYREETDYAGEESPNNNEIQGETFNQNQQEQFQELKKTIGRMTEKLTKITRAVKVLSLKADQADENLRSLNEFVLSVKHYDKIPPQADIFPHREQKSWGNGVYWHYNKQNQVAIPKCGNLHVPIRSINSHKSCVRLYASKDCTGRNIMTSPESYDQSRFTITDFYSIGPCSVGEPTPP